MYDLYCKTTCDHKIGDVKFVEEDCPRCNGKGEYFDVQFDATGDFMLVDRSRRLVQDVKKALLDQLGTNTEDPNWGSELHNARLLRDPNLIKARVRASVVEAEESSQYIVYPDEKIIRIGNLMLLEDESDPRYLELLITVVAENRKEIQVENEIEF